MKLDELRKSPAVLRLLEIQGLVLESRVRYKEYIPPKTRQTSSSGKSKSKSGSSPKKLPTKAKVAANLNSMSDAELEALYNKLKERTQ